MNILLIEDNPDHFTLISDAITAVYSNAVSIKHHELLRPALKELTEVQFDICFCDLDLPDSPIENTVQLLQTVQTSTPIVVLTSLNDIQLATSLIGEGIQDYLPKEYFDKHTFSRICSYAIERKKFYILLEEQNQTLKQKRVAQMKLFSEMAHDLQSPLANIIGYSELLIDESPDIDERTAHALNVIHRNGSSMLESINELMDLARVDAGFIDIHMDRVDIKNVVESLASDYRYALREKGLDWATEYKTDISTIISDERRIYQVLNNLISNAMKYTEKGGISVSISKETTKDNLPAIRFTVKDTGIGVKAEDQAMLFHEYFRTQDVLIRHIRGTGLGLAFIAEIVNALHGEYGVQSQYGEGSEFWVQLPIGAQENSRPAA